MHLWGQRHALLLHQPAVAHRHPHVPGDSCRVQAVGVRVAQRGGRSRQATFPTQQSQRQLGSCLRGQPHPSLDAPPAQRLHVVGWQQPADILRTPGPLLQEACLGGLQAQGKFALSLAYWAGVGAAAQIQGVCECSL